MSSWQTLDAIARVDHARKTRRGEVAYAAATWEIGQGGARGDGSMARAWRRLAVIVGAPGICGTRTCCRVCCPGTPGR